MSSDHESMSHDQEFMSLGQEGNDNWNDCPQGELSRMVRKLDTSRSRVRTRKLVQTGLLSMLLVAGGVVVGGYVLTQNGMRFGDMTFGGITCTECGGHFAEYHDHITGAKLLEDLGLATSMATHLASCKYCQGRFEKSYPGVLQDGVPTSTQPTIGRPRPLLAVLSLPAY